MCKTRYECGEEAEEFSGLRLRVFAPNGKVIPAYSRFVDMAAYGTPGATDCVDLRFCKSAEDEQGVRHFTQMREKLDRSMGGGGLGLILRRTKRDKVGKDLLDDGP